MICPEGVNITETVTQSLQGAENATISMTNKDYFHLAIESMNQNVKGGFSYKAEWDSTPGNPGTKLTSKVGSESVVITRPDGPMYLNQF